MISSATSATGSRVEVVMPQMGVSVADGTVTQWRKRDGDHVEADETICEVTTDKVDVEIPAPTGGVLARVLVEEGEKVAVGTVLAEIETRGEGRGARNEERDPEAPTGSGGEIDRSSFVSPVVRRIADEHGVDVNRVEGHGVGGRVRKADLIAAIGAGTVAPNGDAKLHSDSPYRPEEPGPAPGRPQAAEALVGATRREQMGPMRQSIAQHMLASRRTSAHCTTIVEADFSAVAARRRELAGRRIRPTYLAFVARAVVAALGRHPVLNASIDGEEIVYHEDVNLGIAVALDDGLVVPVVRRAQLLSVEGLAEEIGDAAARARDGGLRPDDTHGATFTITNPGRFGALLATPIISQPQVAILDLEAVTKRPVAVDDGTGGDAVGIRPMGYLCMSWDHRALDGVEAAQFLADVRAGIESAPE